MTDSIRIIITRDCDENGNGGTVIDDAAAILGSIGETKVLDALVAAFADAYGIYEVDDGEGNLSPVTPERNMSYRMRMFATEIVTAYMQKMAAEQARQQAGEQAQIALGTVTIVENTP
jgi:hypothetical protein